MPRKAKQKRLTEWLDREQQALDTGRWGSSWNHHFIRVPQWALTRLKAEGCRTNEWGHVELPSHKSVSLHKAYDHAMVFPGPGTRIDLTRFLPKSTAGTQGSEGEVRRPSVDSGSPLYSSIIVDSLPSTGQVGRVITPDGVSNIPSLPPRTTIEWLTWDEASQRMPRSRRRR